MQFDPDAFGFEMKIDESLEYADAQNEKASWFSFLFGKVKQPIPFTIPIKYVQNPTTIHQTLKAALANRYERAATETHPLVNSANVIPGESGTELANVDEAITHIGMALTSATQRMVVLNVKECPGRTWKQNCAKPFSWKLLMAWLRFIYRICKMGR